MDSMLLHTFSSVESTGELHLIQLRDQDFRFFMNNINTNIMIVSATNDIETDALYR